VSAQTKPIETETAVQALTRQLAESEARFRDIIERNADAIVVVDHDGVIRFVNAEASHLFGKSREILLGSSFGFPVVAGATTELDLAHNGLARVVEMRVVESSWEGESACIASLRDITERKQAEDVERYLIRVQAARSAAERAARRFRFLAEASDKLSATLDYDATMSELVQLSVLEIADWAVVYCTDRNNHLRRFGVAHRDPDKQTAIQNFRESPLILQPSNPVEEAMRTGRPVVRKRLTDPDIDALIVDPRARQLVRDLGLASLLMVPINARGRSLGAIALCSSSEQRLFDDEDLALAENLAARAGLAIDNARLYEQAREANRMKTELLAVISHDLRTPLNSIIGYAQLLDLGIPETLPESCRDRVDRIQLSAGHLLYLIDELMAFARVEGGHEELQKSDIDAGRITREVGMLMEPLAQQKQLKLVVETSDHEIMISTDGDKLRQILVNLVGNAVKYTETGEVQVVALATANGVTIRVSDTGIGISADQLPHIFEPFWQADRSQRAVGGGTGLGLSVVKQLVVLLGGVIEVTSKPDSGSTFSVHLPRSAPVDS
jgi:signal transduction histidine kinase